MTSDISSNFHFSPLGDAALLMKLGNIIDEKVNQRILQVFKTLKNADLPWISDIVPAYSSLAVFYDVLLLKIDSNKSTTFFEQAVFEVKRHLANHAALSPTSSSRQLRIPVCYEDEFALDLAHIATQTNLSEEEIIDLHSSQPYRVYMVGFLPGFAYMGEVADKIATPRKQEPRRLVAAGSVGIAGKQTGIYPLDSPGGWQIIGKTPVSLFNKANQDPVLFHPGDEVRFYSISKYEFTHYEGGLS